MINFINVYKYTVNNNQVMTPADHQVFLQKKRHILEDLNSPLPDLSPKGGPDVQILPLLKLINQHELLVTTSSCAGRVAVYAEGVRLKNSKHEKDQEDENELETSAVMVGGKGGGGRWLYVTHDAPTAERVEGRSWTDILLGDLRISSSADGFNARDTLHRRYVHFKYEPMVSPPFPTC